MFLGIDVASKKQELWLLQDFQDCEEQNKKRKIKSVKIQLAKWWHKTQELYYYYYKISNSQKDFRDLKVKVDTSDP